MSRPEDETLAELTQRQAELDAAEQRILELTNELDTTNRGIIALLTELEAARDAEAEARAEHEVLAERDRIARDLQDQVIHRVFSAGLTLQGIASVLHDPQAARRIKVVIKELDTTIRDLRTAIFGLHDHPQEAISLRAQFTDLVTQVDDDLGFTPAIRFQGPVDAAVPDHIATDLLAAAREALATIARHANASSVEITLHATAEELVLHVSHDGPWPTITSDWHTMRERARSHGGTFDRISQPGTGTHLQWRVPLPRHEEPD